MILESTVKLVLDIYKYHKIIPPRVSKVVIGLGYTGVELEALAYDPFLGLAATLPTIIQSTNCTKIDFAGNLTDKSFKELMSWSYQPPSLERIIGIAALNAASQHILAVKTPYKKIEGDLVDFLKIKLDTKILFIGFMKPMIKKILNKTKFINIIDNNPLIENSYQNIPILKNIEDLKENDLSIDILFCTGTSLINNTLERILSVFRKKAKCIVLIGPTISFLPDILFDKGVDIVGGMTFTDTESTVKVLQEGGGTRYFKNFGRKYNFIKQ
ncbi:MAG: hypothetical protein KGD72_06660 [Candidatus Lokiarchaeota archaeon]|nr:hypothetical protein [Candidatus Lokiarchaeota archaeon]